jgi:polyisoprenyl-teichoic acid--peptidoglycan teichoic acid transferase
MPVDGDPRVERAAPAPGALSEGSTEKSAPRRARPGRHGATERRRRATDRRPARPPSPRRIAQRRLRREGRVRRVRRSGPIVAGVVVVGALVWWQLDSGEVTAPNKSDTATLAAAEVTNTLLVGSEGEGRAATWLVLLSYDPAEQRGAVVYVPAHTAVEIPGRGLQPLGNALQSGDMPLLMVSAESLLGVDIDHYEAVTSSGAAALFAQLGPLTVDVPGEVRLSAGANNARLLFTEGPQELGPSELVDFLYTVGLEGDDVELGARHLAFWDAMLDDFHAHPSVLGASFVAVGAGLGTSDANPSENALLVESLARLDGADLTLTILPVQQVSVGGSELYEADAEKVEAFMEETLTSYDASGEVVEVQVLNGNGVPGIGQDVAEALAGKGFRVALGGNAQNFKHSETEIVTYDASPEGIAAAERARELLGVGRVLVSAQEQGIVSVDLTIVVGKDFLRTR